MQRSVDLQNILLQLEKTKEESRLEVEKVKSELAELRKHKLILTLHIPMM